jgi:hypothetical protein
VPARRSSASAGRPTRAERADRQHADVREGEQVGRPEPVPALAAEAEHEDGGDDVEGGGGGADPPGVASTGRREPGLWHGDGEQAGEDQPAGGADQQRRLQGPPSGQRAGADAGHDRDLTQ